MKKTLKCDNRRIQGKRGFTLVELSVVIALLAILSVMTVTFSTLVGKYVSSATHDYNYSEELSDVKQKLIKELSFLDTSESYFDIYNGALTICDKDGKKVKTISFEGGSLTIGSDTKSYDTINKITFEMNDKCIIKCTVDGTDDVFIYSLVAAKKYTGGEGS